MFDGYKKIRTEAPKVLAGKFDLKLALTTPELP